MIGYTGPLSGDVQEAGQHPHLPQHLSKRLPYEERVLWMENASQVTAPRAQSCRTAPLLARCGVCGSGVWNSISPKTWSPPYTPAQAQKGQDEMKRAKAKLEHDRGQGERGASTLRHRKGL